MVGFTCIVAWVYCGTTEGIISYGLHWASANTSGVTQVTGGLEAHKLEMVRYSVRKNVLPSGLRDLPEKKQISILFQNTLLKMV